MKKVCAIVVTFNRLELLKECVMKLESSDSHLNHILVFNNNSTDGTDKWLNLISENNDKFIIVNNDANLGGAGGFSKAIEIATELTNDEFLWVMDDDTMPYEDALSGLLEATNVVSNNFGFLCSYVEWNDGTPVNMPVLNGKSWFELLNEQLIRVDRATFVSVLIKTQKVEELGLPASDMVIWGDDSEYTNRLSNSAPSYLVPRSIVHHKTPVKVTDVNIITDDINRIHRYYYSYRNALVVARLYSSRKKVVKIVIKDMIMLCKLVFTKADHKWKRITSLIKGTISGLFFAPKIKFIKLSR